MSGISPNKCKRNGKKSKSTTSEVLQVKSMKLDLSTSCGGGGGAKMCKINAKSVDCLRKPSSSRTIKKLFNFNKNQSIGGDISTDELESGIVEKIEKLTLKSDTNDDEGENGAPSTSQVKVDDIRPDDNDEDKPEAKSGDENGDNCDGDNDVDDYPYNCYYHKNSKSIKFTNQVTVLYFNGEDVLCESMEPLKKEIDQQVRNKEMRKEHLLKAGQEVDNLYLF